MAAPHSATAAYKKVVKRHGHWWGSAVKGGSGDPPGTLADVVDAAIPAWAVHMRNKTLGKGPSMKDETKYAPFARAAQDRELPAWEAFDLRPSATRVNVVQTIRDTRWVLTCGVIQAKTPVRARSVAQGFQDPDLRHQLVETAGCVRIRLSHSQLLTLWAPEEWRIWSLDVQNAFLRAAHAFPEWGPQCSMRTWKLRVAAYGLNDKPAALCNAPRKYLSDKGRSNKEVGSTFCVSDHGPCS